MALLWQPTENGPPLRLMHLKFSVRLISQSNECFWSHYHLQTGHETKKKKNPEHVGHLEGQERGKFFNIHFPVSRHPLFCWQENDLTDELGHVFISLSLSSAHLSEIRPGLRDAVVCIRCGLQLASLLSVSGGQKQAAAHGAEELWVAVWEHLEEEGVFARHKLCWSFQAQKKKKKVWLFLLKGFFVWQSHPLFASAPVTIRSGKMSCSYMLSIPDD